MLIDGEQVAFDTTCEDVLHEARTEMRYLLDVPDGAVMNLTVTNQRDSAVGRRCPHRGSRRHLPELEPESEPEPEPGPEPVLGVSVGGVSGLA